jgi:predicted enzyme related to lactoylglutathione lyase
MALKQHTLICQVSDMDRGVAFYRDVLGLAPGYTSPHWSEFKMGETRIGLHPSFDGSPVQPNGQGWVLGVATEDIRSLRSSLEKAGVYVGSNYHDTPSGAVMDFRDPDGNALQAIQVGAKARDLS